MLDKWIQLEEQEYTNADAEWDNFVAAHPQGSVLQSTHWARLKNRFGWTSHRVWLRHDGKLIAGAQILFRSIVFRLAKFAYIPHGPLVDWEDEEQVAVLLNQIDLATYEHRAGILKMEPLIWQDAMPPEKWAAICRRHNLKNDADTLQPPQTILVDLRPSPDHILAAMKQKTRYNIRLAAKKGVTVRQGTINDLPAFIQMMRITGERDGFGVRAPEYYLEAFNLFQESNQVGLFVAEFEKRPLAGVMAFTSGSTAYNLFSASNNEERSRMPNYAVQWAVMQWAKEQNCTHYDLWGVPDAPEAELEAQFTERREGLWGVYRFKRGFGGSIQRTVGAADRIYNKRLYKLYQWRRNR
ncbi:MAG: peptidoglycan bridge formation glycyltransferase FemA/FemB family protein [Anaerolineales bacterium]|nr:peptidoglycan bridge formation glycyltransferase FemA/FemB family protein [Anaerolineales bacterium]